MHCLTIGDIRKGVGTTIVPIRYPQPANPVIASPNEVATKNDFALMLDGASSSGDTAEISNDAYTVKSGVLYDLAMTLPVSSCYDSFGYSIGGTYCNAIFYEDGTGVFKCGISTSIYTVYQCSVQCLIFGINSSVFSMIDVDTDNYTLRINDVGAANIDKNLFSLSLGNTALMLHIDCSSVPSSDDDEFIKIYVEVPFEHSWPTSYNFADNAGVHTFVKSMIESIKKHTTIEYKSSDGGSEILSELVPFCTSIYNNEDVCVLNMRAFGSGMAVVGEILNRRGGDSIAHFFDSSGVPYDTTGRMEYSIYQFAVIPKPYDPYQQGFVTAGMNNSLYWISNVYGELDSYTYNTGRVLDVVFVEQPDGDGPACVVLIGSGLIVYRWVDWSSPITMHFSQLTLDDVPVCINAKLMWADASGYSYVLFVYGVHKLLGAFVTNADFSYWAWYDEEDDEVVLGEEVINIVSAGTGSIAKYYVQNNVLYIEEMQYSATIAIIRIQSGIDTPLNTTLTSYIHTPYGIFFAIRTNAYKNLLFKAERGIKNDYTARLLFQSNDGMPYDTMLEYCGAYSPKNMIVSNIHKSSPLELLKITNERVGWQDACPGVMNGPITLLSNRYCIDTDGNGIYGDINSFNNSYYFSTNLGWWGILSEVISLRIDFGNEVFAQREFIYIPQIGVVRDAEIIVPSSDNTLSMYGDGTTGMLYTINSNFDGNTYLQSYYDGGDEIAEQYNISDYAPCIVNGLNGMVYLYHFEAPDTKADASYGTLFVGACEVLDSNHNPVDNISIDTIATVPNVVDVSLAQLYNISDPYVVVSYVGNDNNFYVMLAYAYNDEFVSYCNIKIDIPSSLLLSSYMYHRVLPCATLIRLFDTYKFYFWVDGVGLYETSAFEYDEPPTTAKLIYACEESACDQMMGATPIYVPEGDCWRETIMLMVAIPHTTGVKMFVAARASAGLCL